MSIFDDINNYGASPILAEYKGDNNIEDIFPEERYKIKNMYKEMSNLIYFPLFINLTSKEQKNIINYITTLIDGRAGFKKINNVNFCSFFLMVLAFKKSNYSNQIKIPIFKINNEFEFLYFEDIKKYLNKIDKESNLININYNGENRVEFNKVIQKWSKKDIQYNISA